MKREESAVNKMTLTEWIDKHPKLVFAFRCVLWAIAAAILPFVFIAWRYGIFTQQSQIKLTGWGFIAIIILIVFLITFMKYIYKGLKPGFLKQCVSGLVSIVLPLLVLYLLVVSIAENLNAFKQALGCVILCELIAIPLNPFPSWLEEKRIKDGKEKAESMSDIFWNKFFSRNNKEGE